MKPPKLERRDLIAPIALDASEPKLRGYIAKFGQPSRVLREASVSPRPFVEVIAPGAFRRTLRSSNDIPALFNHDQNAILGRTSAGTLVLTEDAVGLAFELELPDTTLGRDVRESVRRGDIRGCSFGFFPIRDQVEARGARPQLRTLHDVELYEVTPACIFPAYSASEVAYRARQIRGDEEDASRHRLGLARRKLIIGGIGRPIIAPSPRKPCRAADRATAP